MSTYLEKAVRIAGGEGRGHKKRAAEAFGCRPPQLTKMLRDNHVPVSRCRAIEAATGGKVTAEQLRPDIFKPKPIRRSA